MEKEDQIRCRTSRKPWHDGEHHRGTPNEEGPARRRAIPYLKIPVVKKLIPFTHSPELMGIVCGLMIFSAWPCLELILLKAGWALGGIAVIAGAAGFIVAARAGVVSPGIGMESRVRRGAWAGFFAVMVAAACLVFMTRMKFGGYASLRAILVAVASVMPAIMVGTVAAGGGAYLLRRREVPTPEPVPGANDLPRAARLTIRAGIFGALLIALVSPLIPESPKVTQVAMPRATREEEPVRPLPPPRETFKYTMPEALKTALPVTWKVQTQRELGWIQPDHCLSFTKDERLLIGLDVDGRILVQDLDTHDRWRMPTLPYPVSQVSCSPDGQRLFVVLNADPRRVGVVTINTGVFTPLPQPRKHAVPDCRISWWKDQGVVFLTDPKSPLMFDLETLEFDPAKLTAEELGRINNELGPGLPKNDRWVFSPGSLLTSAELPEVEGTSDWQWSAAKQLVMSDQVHASSRIFSEIDVAGIEKLIGVTNGSKVLRFRNHSLMAFYFDTGPVSPLRWKLTMPHGPEKMRDWHRAMQALPRGELSLLMYAPLINPLNQKTIGPDRDRPKAILHFLRWEGTEAEVWIESSMFPYSPGDVLADVHVLGEAPRLLAFEQPHHWWMLVPEPLPDATDVSKLPLRKDFTKGSAPTGEVLARAAEVVKPLDAEAESTTAEEQNDIQKAVSTLVYTHHAAASSGRLEDVVNDYAERVDHFNNGMVDREFIHKDEVKYHEKYRFIRENVITAVAVTSNGPGRVEANYIMMNEWQRLADNVSGSGTFRVILTLENQPRGWKIIKHRAVKQD